MSACDVTLKKEATKPAAANVLQQQVRFVDFVARYKDERPHQALETKVPADLHVRSLHAYRGLDGLPSAYKAVASPTG